ncbi:M17 family metallopeptidase [Gracilibacillus saliphilus]|uniref:M17 family metallopeptidase n=1 Tax=Gracilibacillus saliphilus TaxID=543890 RepID=UPI0013D5418B|nr:leucyl aminopeptidase family protein [Gracilibacillus saliphilus]
MNASVQFITSVRHIEDIALETFKKNPIQCVYRHDEYCLYVYLSSSAKTIESIKFIAGELRKQAEMHDVKALDIAFHTLRELNHFSLHQSIAAFFEGWYLASYRFQKYKSAQQDLTISLHYNKEYKELALQAKLVADAVCVARDLCNEPANQLTPSSYVNEIGNLFKNTDVNVTILDYEQLIEKGFSATYEVGKGSQQKPKVVLLNYENGINKKMALIGKGVTFDSGGINSKQEQDIVDMKMDMGGSAAVIGAIKLIADLKLKVTIQAIIPLVENRPSSNAYLPSHVITYANGTTVEIGNTDAEGRLILADGIIYAQEMGAEWIADIATLTGSIGHALGLKRAGIYSNQLETIDYYNEISEITGDFVWPMPIVEEYQDLLNSDIADIKNIASSPYGGSITAALFLQSFLKKTSKWYHIDMANVVKSYKEDGYYVSGASGFGVRLLTELIKRERD